MNRWRRVQVFEGLVICWSRLACLASLVDLVESWLLLRSQVDFELVLNNPQEPVGMVCVYSKNVCFTAEAVW